MRIGAKLIVAFFVFYSLFGLYLFIEKGTPNDTNDFIFHYFKAKGEFSQEVAQYYNLESYSSYPSLLHQLTQFFTFNKYTFYLFFVFLIIVAIPYLLFRIAGDKAIIVYLLGVSFPHMALYSAVYPSMFVFLLFLIYLTQRKNLLIWGLLGFIASLIHKEGAFLFLAVGAIELIVWRFKENKNIVSGFLVGGNIFSPVQVFNILMFHTNFLLIWISRKSFDFFYSLLFLLSFVGTAFDLRMINLAQLVLCIVLAKNDFGKKTWILLILLGAFNTFSFCWETIRFLY